MRQLNGVYTQAYNRRHVSTGHLFQGRFKGILVEKDAYLLELSRYIVLNPVRARMVRSAKDWPWSSYRATAGLTSCPDFLTTDFQKKFQIRNQAMAVAYRSGHYTLKQIGDFFWRKLCHGESGG
jgi:hypothetical protein